MILIFVFQFASQMFSSNYKIKYFILISTKKYVTWYSFQIFQLQFNKVKPKNNSNTQCDNICVSIVIYCNIICLYLFPSLIYSPIKQSFSKVDNTRIYCVINSPSQMEIWTSLLMPVFYEHLIIEERNEWIRLLNKLHWLKMQLMLLFFSITT